LKWRPGKKIVSEEQTGRTKKKAGCPDHDMPISIRNGGDEKKRKPSKGGVIALC